MTEILIENAQQEIEITDDTLKLIEACIKAVCDFEECDFEAEVSVTVVDSDEIRALNKEHREKYHICVSRAVANLSTLSEYCLPFVRMGGYMMAYKGADASNEAEEAKKAMKILGGNLHKTVDTPIDASAEEHKILLIKKVASTPSKYPRKAGSPAKEPLK